MDFAHERHLFQQLSLGSPYQLVGLLEGRAALSRVQLPPCKGMQTTVRIRAPPGALYFSCSLRRGFIGPLPNGTLASECQVPACQPWLQELLWHPFLGQLGGPLKLVSIQA